MIPKIGATDSKARKEEHILAYIQQYTKVTPPSEM